MTDLLDAAAGFVWRTARLLDRHRFAHLFLDGDRAPVLAALAAYQNPDGGFGNALEPDLRGPASQPEPAWKWTVSIRRSCRAAAATASSRRSRPIPNFVGRSPAYSRCSL